MTSAINPFGKLGVWLSRKLPLGESDSVAQVAESLGYDTIWRKSNSVSRRDLESHAM